MALSTDAKRRIAKWFVQMEFRGPKRTAEITKTIIFDAIDDVDDWIIGDPAGDTAPTRQASFIAVMDASWITPMTNADTATLFAGVALEKAGKL